MICKGVVMLSVTRLEPRDCPATGVVVLWEQGDPWVESEWIRGIVHYGINQVAGRVTNQAVPVVYLEVWNKPLPPDRLAEGVNYGAAGAPYYGVMAFDFARIFSDGWDVVGIVSHETGHALVGAGHTVYPYDLMGPTARTNAQPWDGTLTTNDRQAFAVMGFQTDQ